VKRMTKQHRGAVVLLLGAILSAGCDSSDPAEPVLFSKKPAEAYQYTVLNYPGATWTQAFRMNTRGDVVGFYADTTGMHGFVLRGRNYESISFDGADMTHARGINDRGDIVGDYVVDGIVHGFLLSNGRFTTIDVLDAIGTRLWDINASGEISGEYQASADGPWRAFTWRKGEFRPVTIPNATMSAGFGINNQGEVVGHYRLPHPGGGATKMLGFLWRDGDVTQIDYPVPNLMSCASGISSHAIVGHYQDSVSRIVYGYVWQDGEFTAILRVPYAAQTYPFVITPSGTIAGYHWDATAANWRGFVAEPLNRAGR
jgi:hypothetical protein